MIIVDEKIESVDRDKHHCDSCGEISMSILLTRYHIQNPSKTWYFALCLECDKELYREVGKVLKSREWGEDYDE